MNAVPFCRCNPRLFCVIPTLGPGGITAIKGAGLGLYVTFQEAGAQNPLEGKKIVNYNDICHVVLPQGYHVPVGNAWLFCDHFD